MTVVEIDLTVESLNPHLDKHQQVKKRHIRKENLMTKVRITVVARLDFNEIHGNADLGCSAKMDPVCGMFTEGQEFVTVGGDMPQGFCPGAFADIFRYISGLRFEANYPWMNEKGKVLACCTDGFRPVVFRLERIED